MSGIFISYRREDTGGYAGRLSDRLRDRFGKDQVFMDIETIEPGVDFVDVLTNAVGSCKVLIAVIGRMWLTITDADGNRRLDDPKDFTRIEIRTALERGIKVIPLLIEDASMPPAEKLPEDLQSLARRQSLPMSNSRWSDDIKRLIEALEKEMGSRARVPVSGRNIFAAGTVALVLSAIIGYYALRSPRTMPSPGITSPPAAISGLRPPSQNVATYKPPAKASKPKPVQVPKTEKSVPPDKRPSTQITKPTLLSATTSGDSTTVILKDVSGEERKFIPLGQDRIQRIFNSQNGSWCLVVCKVRGQPQYFAFAVDLASGEEQRTLEIPTMPERVAFERSDVVMSFSGGESKRFALRQ